MWCARFGQIKDQFNDLQTYFRIHLRLDSSDMRKHNGVNQIILTSTNTPFSLPITTQLLHRLTADTHWPNILTVLLDLVHVSKKHQMPKKQRINVFCKNLTQAWLTRYNTELVLMTLASISKTFSRTAVLEFWLQQHKIQCRQWHDKWHRLFHSANVETKKTCKCKNAH